MADLHILKSERPVTDADVHSLIDDLVANRDRISSIVVSYIPHCEPGEETDIVTNAAGNTIERIACAGMLFRSETDPDD